MDIDLTKYNLLALSLSGGKDSMNIALETVAEAEKRKVKHRILAIHSDTSAEWPQTQDEVSKLCKSLAIPLQIVYPRYPLPDYITMRGKFPSMQCRFCTGLKTDAIEKLIRNLFPFKQESKILSITGERREESTHRAKLDEFCVHKELTAGNRQVFCYRPIIDWKVGKVWDRIKTSGLPPHPAYTEYGNERLSCAICVFACYKDIWNGAIVRPDLVERYLEVERKTGFLFRHKQSLASILEKGAVTCQLQAS
jgi:3'-phosphoadenosine 5'-phosphosulfate sulfotransferase (PAPS reductase)/FAD synthetase